MSVELLRDLIQVPSPSGEESAMKSFILDYVNRISKTWKVKPLIIEGEDFQDCIILIFGKPRVAAFAHIDTTGFTVRYQDQLVPVGGPEIEGGELLVGKDELGAIECKLKIDDDDHAHYAFGRAIQTGTCLVFKSEFHENKSSIQAPYLDNRVGIYNLLRIAETLEDGALVFSCWEEHGGGSVPILVKHLYEKWHIRKMLISDVTWIPEGVRPGEGVVISYRDRSIPRKSFVRQIIQIAALHHIDFQTEVEGHGSSDGREIQASPYPIDWCFIGAPVQNVHTNKEVINMYDMKSMIRLYELLMQTL
jgi:putative aminopeptidase FrvX